MFFQSNSWFGTEETIPNVTKTNFSVTEINYNTKYRPTVHKMLCSTNITTYGKER